MTIVGSAGSLGPMKEILGALPRDLSAAVVLLMHRSADRKSYLTSILAKRSRLPVVDAEDGQELRAGCVFVAPQGDTHVSIDGHVIRLRPGPTIHGFRPAGDSLFESAAASYGGNSVGVVLSGVGRNGEAGLAAIKRAGGLALVQDPGEAEQPSMPRHALQVVHPDLCGSAQEIAAGIAGLCPAVPAVAPARAAAAARERGGRS